MEADKQSQEAGPRCSRSYNQSVTLQPPTHRLHCGCLGEVVLQWDSASASSLSTLSTTMTWQFVIPRECAQEIHTHTHTMWGALKMRGGLKRDGRWTAATATLYLKMINWAGETRGVHVCLLAVARRHLTLLADAVVVPPISQRSREKQLLLGHTVGLTQTRLNYWITGDKTHVAHAENNQETCGKTFRSAREGRFVLFLLASSCLVVHDMMTNCLSVWEEPRLL